MFVPFVGFRSLFRWSRRGHRKRSKGGPAPPRFRISRENRDCSKRWLAVFLHLPHPSLPRRLQHGEWTEEDGHVVEKEGRKVSLSRKRRGSLFPVARARRKINAPTKVLRAGDHLPAKDPPCVHRLDWCIALVLRPPLRLRLLRLT